MPRPAAMSDRWIIRRGAKRSGFRYLGLDGRPITNARERARIDALRVPESDRKRNALSAIRMVAAELGNTPAICRKSYVHPIVLARYADAGETMILTPARRARRRRSSVAHYPEGRALVRFSRHALSGAPAQTSRRGSGGESGLGNGESRTRKGPVAR